MDDRRRPAMTRQTHLPTIRIDPQKKLTLFYRNETVAAFEGDTIATALYAHGVRVFTRSLKYRRPRGLYSLQGESANTLMSANGIPNVCADNTPAVDRMVLRPQNVVGAPETDITGGLGLFSRFMGAGFYYNYFHKPAPLWPAAARLIRKAAGPGKLSPTATLKGRFDERYIQADVCVIGGGPAGMHAAQIASSRGLRVVLLESKPRLGGSFDYRPGTDENRPPLYEQARGLSSAVESTPGVRIFKNTRAVGIYQDNLVTAVQHKPARSGFNQTYIEIRATSIVAAVGCLERPSLFKNNDRPGIMQVGCAHQLIRTFGIIPGKTVLFGVGHDLGLEAAIDFFDLGLSVCGVADCRKTGQDQNLIMELKKRNILYLDGWAPFQAHGINHIKGITLKKIGTCRYERFSCDLFATSAGLAPDTALIATAGAAFAYDDHTGFFLPDKMPKHIHGAGRLLGRNDFNSIAESGKEAGFNASLDCKAVPRPKADHQEAKSVTLPRQGKGSDFITVTPGDKKAFLCFDEDTTLHHIDQARRLGFDTPEPVKRFTSCGTGPGQGAVSGHNLPLYTASFINNPDRPAVPTTVRPPVSPVLIAAYEGYNIHMSKQTPLHDRQTAEGGKMEQVGCWSRARYFSDDKTCKKEVENVRRNVGMLDASTLGKFRLFGPDALKVLQRIYVGDMARVSGDRITYSAMCNEDGCMIDDGVVVKPGPDDYYFTTSTARADITAQWIRYHTRYDDWKFYIVNLTDAFGVINLAGPRARRVLEKITSEDISNQTLPFKGYRKITVNRSIPVGLFRLGFIGELSFELHIPASYADAVWVMLKEAGRELGIENFGLEAQNRLRMEKGHIIIGSETEQRTTLHDLGLGYLWNPGKQENHTVGGAALKRTKDQKGRLKLVGFKMTDRHSEAPKDGSLIVDTAIRGYVCTARHSHVLKEPIGMALVEDRLARPGTLLKVFEDNCNNRPSSATVVPLPFYDPEGKRIRM